MLTLLSCLSQVKAAVLDPDNEFNVERTLTKEDVQKLIQVESQPISCVLLTFLVVCVCVHADMCESPTGPHLSCSGHCQDAGPF